MQTVHVEFELPLPTAMAIGLNATNAKQETLKMLALFLYERGQISLGKACEIGGFTQWEFTEMNRQLNIPTQYTPEDLQADLQRLNNV